MEDDSKNFFQSLKHEWKLLWADLDEEIDPQDLEAEIINLKDLKNLSNSPKELSQLRKKLFQKQEHLANQIDLAKKRFEVLQKRGANRSLVKKDIQVYLDQLQEEGRIIHEEIMRINDKLNFLRNHKPNPQI